MHTLTDVDLPGLSRQLIDDARRGEPALVTVDGEAVMMTVPLGVALGTPQVRLELAVRLFDSDQIGLGTAARIAGLGHSAMIDELGRRSIAVARYSPGELDQELELMRDAAGR